MLFADAVLRLSMPRGNLLLLCVVSSGDIKYMCIMRGKESKKMTFLVSDSNNYGSSN